MVLISLRILLRLVLKIRIVMTIWLSDFDCPESFEIRLLGVNRHLELIVDFIRIGVLLRIQLLESTSRGRAKNWLIEVFWSQSFPRLSNFDHAQVTNQLLSGTA